MSTGHRVTVPTGWSPFVAGVGGLLLGAVRSAVLLPALAAILLVSAAKTWRHR